MPSLLPMLIVTILLILHYHQVRSWESEKMVREIEKAGW